MLKKTDFDPSHPRSWASVAAMGHLVSMDVCELGLSRILVLFCSYSSYCARYGSENYFMASSHFQEFTDLVIWNGFFVLSFEATIIYCRLLIVYWPYNTCRVVLSYIRAICKQFSTSFLLRLAFRPPFAKNKNNNKACAHKCMVVTMGFNAYSNFPFPLLYSTV